MSTVRPQLKEPYSYRVDEQVPAFDDAHPIVVMDGACALCTAGARTIARFDRSGDLRIAVAGTDLGRGLLLHYGLQPDDPGSWLFLHNGRAYGSLDAVIRAGWRMGGIMRGLVVLRMLPSSMADWLYGHVARNRIRWFGRADMCASPSPELRRRLIS